MRLGNVVVGSMGARLWSDAYKYEARCGQQPALRVSLPCHLKTKVSPFSGITVRCAPHGGFTTLADLLRSGAMSENCEIPGVADSFLVANGIRRIAHGYGNVKVFRTYLEVSDKDSSRSHTIRSDLQSCGVTLIDCPHNGRKDVADKIMMGTQRCSK